MKRENERIEEKKRRGNIRDFIMLSFFSLLEVNHTMTMSYGSSSPRVSRKWFVC